MTKKERVLAVMKKEQVDMIPAGFWFHYKSDYTVQQMIDEHMKLFRTTDMDIIKIMQDYPYPISGKITCADDWYHIQVKGTDSEEFAKMAEIIRGIRKEAGKDVLIFQTMFGPFKAASMTLKKLQKQLRLVLRLLQMHWKSGQRDIWRQEQMAYIILHSLVKSEDLKKMNGKNLCAHMIFRF